MDEETKAREIAARLTKPQADLIAHMEGFVPLGCNEGVAVRLSRANTRRPALTLSCGLGITREWALNTAGRAVRAALLAQRDTGKGEG